MTQTAAKNNVVKLPKGKPVAFKNLAELRKLPHRDKRYEATDSKQDGLRVVVYPAPSTRKSFVTYQMKAGDRRKINLGSLDTASLGEARAEVAALSLLKAWPEEVAPVPVEPAHAPVPTGAITVGDLITARVNDLEPAKSASAGISRATRYRALNTEFGTVEVNSLTTVEISRKLKEIRERRGRNIARECKNALNSLLAEAAENGEITGNPCASIKTKGIGANYVKQYTGRDYLSREEIADLLPILHDASTHRARIPRLVVLIALHTGCRGIEVTTSHTDSVEFYANANGETVGLWTISEAVAKNGKQLQVPLTPTVASYFLELRKLGKGHELLGAGRKAPSVRVYFQGLQRATGKWDTGGPAAGFGLHALRRSFATYAGEMAPPHIVDKALNHSMPAVDASYKKSELMTERYALLKAWDAALLDPVATLPSLNAIGHGEDGFFADLVKIED